MIRTARPDDLPTMIEFGRAFHKEAGHEERHAFCTFVDEDFAATLKALGQAGLLLAVEKDGRVVGMAAADMAPAIYNHKVLLGRECFWYLDPNHRKGLGRQLIGALEATTKSFGARLFDVVAEEGKRSDALARMYRAGSYSPAERTFRKEL